MKRAPLPALSAMRRWAPVLTLLAALINGAPAAQAARASLPDVEDEVMCVTCKIPLNIAQSPQADRERAFIARLIAQGATKREIKVALVDEYGRNVLALPDRGGFGLTAYLIPPVLLALVGLGLAVALPRWRRRSPTATASLATTGGGAGDLSPADARRLDEDLGRYDL